MILSVLVYVLFVSMLFLLSRYIPLLMIPVVHMVIAIYCLLYDYITLHPINGINKLYGKYVCYTIDKEGEILRHFTGGAVPCFPSYIRAVSMIIPMIGVKTGGDYDSE